jgi:hypothetical protein
MTIVNIDIKEITTIFYYIIISFSVIIGCYWAYIKFIKRHEEASIMIKIKKPKIYKDNIRERTYLLVQVLIHNNGNREVVLYYDYKPKKLAQKDEEPERRYKSEITLYYVDSNNNLEKIDSRIGLTTGNTKQFTGRLRTGVKTILPYLLMINQAGIYFIEYKIDVNMTRYYKGKDYDDSPIKIWSARLFYQIKEKDIKYMKSNN